MKHTDTENALSGQIRRHICYTLGNDPDKPGKYACYAGLAFAVRDRLVAKWIKTQRALYETLSKRVYFFVSGISSRALFEKLPDQPWHGR